MSKNKYVTYDGFQDPETDRDILLDTRGAMKTQQLFIDVNVASEVEPLYTMRDRDHKGYISAYQIYMHSTDETEAALKLVGSLKHWRKLCDLDWFVNGHKQRGFEGLNQWREDMVARDRTRARKALLKLSDVNSAAAKQVALTPDPEKITVSQKNVGAKKKKKKVADTPVEHVDASLSTIMERMKAKANAG